MNVPTISNKTHQNLENLNLSNFFLFHFCEQRKLFCCEPSKLFWAHTTHAQGTVVGTINFTAWPSTVIITIIISFIFAGPSNSALIQILEKEIINILQGFDS